mgnify:CR=1 FL=1
MSLIDAYQQIARDMAVLLPDELLALLAQEDCLAALPLDELSFIWEEPVAIEELADIVFSEGPFGGTERLILFGGERERPVGLDYRFSNTDPGVFTWDGSTLEHQYPTLGPWLSDRADDVERWLDDNLCPDDDSVQAALRLRTFLESFEDASRGDDSYCHSEEAIGEIIRDYQFRIWNNGFQSVPVVGLNHYDYPALRDSVSVGTVVSLRREPSNAYDDNAIAVEVELDGHARRMLGYVSKEENAFLAYQMRLGFQPVGRIMRIHPRHLVISLTHALTAEQTIDKVTLFQHD